MLLTKEVEIKINNRYVKYYKDKGYDISGGDILLIKVTDLPDKSHVNVECKCDNCSEITKIKYYNYINNISNGGKYYCKKCKNIKTEKTNIERYGVKTTLLEPKTQEKIKNTIRDKYGVEHYSQTEEFKERIKKNNLEKYGVDSYFQTENIKKQRFDKYGVEYYPQTNEFKEKKKETCLEKYGVEHYSQTKEFKERIKENIINKYNEEYNIKIIKITDDILKIKCNICNEEYNIHKWLLKNRLHKYKINPCIICNPINSYTSSGKENKMIDFIKEIYSDEIIENDRKILNGKEIDIYLPDLNLAFEFNGLWWHNELYKDKNYHLEKTEKCLDKGIHLNHIWEDDWNFKQDIVRSIILNKIGKTTNKIFARKCVIKEITDNKIVKKFLNENHIQDSINSSVKIGLYYNDELVSLMTFGKKRKIMNSTSKEGEYELLRFCNILNTNVIGGANKLFIYFIKKYNPKEIITYANRNYFKGDLYKTLGFEYVSKSEPNYYYVIDGIRKHRFGFRKDILVKEGYDKNMTEHEIMLSRNIYRIYDSGTLKFIYKTIPS
ncbi:MAG: hypothetical protein M0R46_13875 [Candidatus Muirbacterium halophilum]|nr:hypothetical protein [Candidatus Muirbacterium halophilum]